MTATLSARMEREGAQMSSRACEAQRCGTAWGARSESWCVCLPRSGRGDLARMRGRQRDLYRIQRCACVCVCAAKVRAWRSSEDGRGRSDDKRTSSSVRARRELRARDPGASWRWIAELGRSVGRPISNQTLARPPLGRTLGIDRSESHRPLTLGPVLAEQFCPRCIKLFGDRIATTIKSTTTTHRVRRS
jgi:hypothetical protein